MDITSNSMKRKTGRNTKNSAARRPVPSVPVKVPVRSVQKDFSVAVVGLSGAGKTILTAVLAKRFSLVADQIFYLDPEDKDTGVHVETIWDTLNNKRDWPDLTVNGTCVDLKWKLISRARGLLCDFRVIDCSGQDLGKIFGSENSKEAEGSGEYFEMLKSYCLNADIVVYTVNLEDALGQGDPLRKVGNDLTIRAIMKHISRQGSGNRKAMCLVLTQVDKFRELEKKHNGWDEVIARNFPHAFSQLASESDVPIFPVAAVKTTRVVPDEQGIPHRMPERDFASEGLEDLLSWIAANVEDSVDQQRREIERIEEAEQQAARQEELKRQNIFNIKMAIIVAAILIAALFIIWFTTGKR